MDLLTIGEAFDDLIMTRLPRLPRLGEELRVPDMSVTIGGGALITAIAAARLGVRVGVMSAVSEAGARALRDERVRLLNLRHRNERGALSVALSAGRDRAFVTFDGVNRHLEPRLLASLASMRIAPRHAHFALSPQRCRAWIPVVERFRRRGCSTSWDFGWNDRLLGDPSFDKLVATVDWLFVNELEAKLYSRVRLLRQAFAEWPRRARAVVIKLGPRGAVALTPDTVVRGLPPNANVLDTTGAGDAFNAGFLSALSAGATLANAVKLGNYIAARSTEQAGGIAALPLKRALPAWAKRVLEGV